MPESILVFCAHPDDEVFGPGGTIARYAKEGKDCRAVIFTYGEESHPWQKGEVTTEIRVKESQKAAGILGYQECVFLGLHEGKIAQEMEESDALFVLRSLLLKHKPTKVFTHSVNDPHPDHRAVHRVVKALCASLKSRPDVYSFDIWTVVRLRERDAPALVVDVSDSFPVKLKALACFRSQGISVLSLVWSVHLRARLSGLKHGCGRAEVFARVPLGDFRA